MTECVADTELRWSCVTKDPEETFPVLLSAFGMCAQYWEANEQWDPNEYCWPTKPNGFVARCSNVVPGRSANKEPRWNIDAAEGALFTDGSVTWILEVPTLITGLIPITNVVVTPDTGLNVAGAVVVENTKIALDYTGGTIGEQYEVKVVLTISGRPRVGRQVVHVAKQ